MVSVASLDSFSSLSLDHALVTVAKAGEVDNIRMVGPLTTTTAIAAVAASTT